MTIFKPLSADDRVSTKTLLHEAIPITGSIVSGTYADGNIQNFTHGMFQSVYDYPYLSSSANHIFDITFGTSDDSLLAVTNQSAKKDNVYNQMAQVLMGYDQNGAIQKFDEDGDLTTTGDKLNDVTFLSLSRLLSKDEIKKGSFELELGVSGTYYAETNHNAFGRRIKITDEGAATSYKVNSPAGEYGILYATQSAGPAVGILNHTSPAKTSLTNGSYWKAGLIFYQAGVVVLTSSIFMRSADGNGMLTADKTNSSIPFDATGTSFTGSLISHEISGTADELRHRIYNLQFNNTIELNSTVYFCRAKHNEFNYSANPTYLTGSQLRVKNQATDTPISYITSIGLYSADNQLLAVGKFSEPVRKDSNIELTFRTRLDY
jgi:hypothetical protein